VSPNVFYEFFETKEQCFLETHDAIAAVEIERVRDATAGAGSWREQLRAGSEAFLELIVAEPAAARLALVEIHAVGARALEHQQATLDAHERLLEAVLAGAPDGASVGQTTRKALIAGARGVVAGQLLAGRPGGLAGLAEPIVRWASCYTAALPATIPEPFGRARRAAPARLPRLPAARRGGEERVAGHRERIMRAVAELSCESSYAALRMPAITARAGVSNQTFYEHFPNKHEAFMACYDRVSRRALAAVLASFQGAPSWPEAVRASLATLLEHIAAEPEFARLGLFEVLAAGPDARRRAEDRAGAFTAMLTPGAPSDTGVPRGLLGALVAAGIWGVIQHHIIHGRTRRLAELTPALTYVALAPFIGAVEAYEVAVGEVV
jgi:AcrR family transcriptional regulator